MGAFGEENAILIAYGATPSGARIWHRNNRASPAGPIATSGLKGRKKRGRSWRHWRHSTRFYS